MTPESPAVASGTVLAICRVHALIPDRGNGVTAIDKRPVDAAVRVKPLGMHGDVQVDRKHHGGEDQALYAYADEDVAQFERALGRELPAGTFGENLRTRGLDVSGAVIGERWRIGAKVVLEVTSPRQPCGTFARRMRVPGWVEQFTAAGAPGAYLRVVRAGDIRSGDRVEVVSRPGHGVTIGGWFTGERPEDARSLLAAAASGSVAISSGVRRHAEQALRRDAARV